MGEAVGLGKKGVVLQKSQPLPVTKTVHALADAPTASVVRLTERILRSSIDD